MKGRTVRDGQVRIARSYTKLGPRIVAARAFTHTFRGDGRIRGAKRTEPADKLDSMLDPDAIATNYWNVCGNRAALCWGNGTAALDQNFLVGPNYSRRAWCSSRGRHGCGGTIMP